MGTLSFKERVDRVGQHIVRARLFFDLWFYFEAERTRAKILDTMEEYNAFFRYTPHAYLATYVIYIAGVFETGRSDTINLESLVREAKLDGRLSSKYASSAELILQEAKPIAKKVAILRHNAFAHRSAKTSYDDAFVRADVTPDQLRDLTDLALRVGNMLLSAAELQEQYFTSLPKAAAEKMMRALARKEG